MYYDRIRKLPKTPARGCWPTVSGGSRSPVMKAKFDRAFELVEARLSVCPQMREDLQRSGGVMSPLLHSRTVLHIRRALAEQADMGIYQQFILECFAYAWLTQTLTSTDRSTSAT